MLQNIILYSSLLLCLACSLPLENNDINDGFDSGGSNVAYLGSSIFGKPNEESGRKLKTWKENSGVNPEELGNYIEGDILFPSKLARNGLIAETARWPDGIIPYEISGHFTAKDKQTIKNAMEQYHKYTCIRFRPRTDSDPDWISITSGNSGCWSSIGRTGGRQEVNLQSPGCLVKVGTTIHELLHAVGFHHEQSRWERDSYVTINWNNIQKGKENNFKKATKDKVSGFGISYDYGSVMHYSQKAFSQNGEPTISINTESDVRIGQREGFSQKDVDKVQAMYNCPPTNETVATINYGTHNSENNKVGGLGGLISMLLPQ